MSNLESFGVQALNENEIKNIDGGWVVLALRGLAIVASAALMYHEANCEKC